MTRKQKEHASREETFTKDNAFQLSHGKGNIHENKWFQENILEKFFFTGSTLEDL